MEGVIGEIRGFAANFAPRAWATCSGQILAISSNTALFSILGTTFGGDGRTSFGLPDLRGRMPLGSGSGPGLSNIRLGQMSGSEDITLTSAYLPPHSHYGTMNARREQGTAFNPSGTVLAADTTASIYSSNAPDVQMSASAATVNDAGGSQPFSLRNPYLGINMIICMQGIYPSRN